MPYQPQHGDRVCLGTFTGPKGTVIRCLNRQTRTYYFKVKLDDGTWTRCERVVAESAGRFNRECTDCEVRFLADGSYDPLCPNCESRQRCVDSRRAADASPSHAFGAGRPRVVRHPIHSEQEPS